MTLYRLRSVLFSYVMILAVCVCGCSVGISPDGHRNDEEIIQDIRRALDAEDTLKGSRLHIESKNGRVKLTGEVNSPLKAVHAEMVASGIRGVQYVKNKIRLTSIK